MYEQHEMAVGMADRDYRQSAGISSSMIRSYALEGPWLCYHRYVAKDMEPLDSDAKRLGRAFHLAMAWPDGWKDKVRLLPGEVGGEDLNLRKPAHREWKRRHEEDARLHGLELIGNGEWQQLQGMIESVYANPAAAQFVGRGAMVETAGFAQYGASSGDSVRVKALADLLIDDVVVDFETTRHALARDFRRDAYYKGYNFQAAHYLDVFQRSQFVIITVRSEYPYESNCYQFSADKLVRARKSNAYTLDRIADNMRLGVDAASWHSDGWGDVTCLEFVEEFPH